MADIPFVSQVQGAVGNIGQAAYGAVVSGAQYVVAAGQQTGQAIAGAGQAAGAYVASAGVRTAAAGQPSAQQASQILENAPITSRYMVGPAMGAEIGLKNIETGWVGAISKGVQILPDWARAPAGAFATVGAGAVIGTGMALTSLALLPAATGYFLQNPVQAISNIPPGLGMQAGQLVKGFQENPALAAGEIAGPILLPYAIHKIYEPIQPRIAEAEILIQTPPKEWGATHAAINIYQTVKGLEVRGASTPDLALVESIPPGAATEITSALAQQTHAIFGRATEIGQMPPDWIEPRGYTYDVDILMTGKGAEQFTSQIGEKGVFDIHPFPKNYPIGTPEPVVEYATKPAVNPLPKSVEDLLFKKVDPFAEVEIELRSKTGLLSRESAAAQKSTGEIVPLTDVERQFTSVSFEDPDIPNLIDWHTHPSNILVINRAEELGMSVEELTRMPSEQDIVSYGELAVKEGRIVTADKTVIVRPSPSGEPIIEYREPILTAEIETGIVSEKLRIQTQRKVASILGEESPEGGWQIGPPEHRLKDVYDTMRYASFFASEERAAGGVVSSFKAGRLEQAVLTLQEYYGKPENIARYSAQDVAIYGPAIREFRLGAPQPGIGGGGEPIFTPLPGYAYPTSDSIQLPPSLSPLMVVSPSAGSSLIGVQPISSVAPYLLPSSVISPSYIPSTSPPSTSYIPPFTPSYPSPATSPSYSPPPPSSSPPPYSSLPPSSPPPSYNPPPPILIPQYVPPSWPTGGGEKRMRGRWRRRPRFVRKEIFPVGLDISTFGQIHIPRKERRGKVPTTPRVFIGMEPQIVPKWVLNIEHRGPRGRKETKVGPILPEEFEWRALVRSNGR